METEIIKDQYVTITAKENFLIWLTEDTKKVYVFEFEKENREDLIKALDMCKHQATAKNNLHDPNPEDKPRIGSYNSAAPIKCNKELENNSKNDYVQKGDYEDKFEENTDSMILGSENYKQKEMFTDCVQGMCNDRTFVIMGNNILVYSSSCEVPNSLEYLTMLPVVSKDHNFIPRNPILHDGEKSLLMIEQTETGGSVYRMDLEAGKIVEEYKSDGVYQITHINKNAQTTTEKVFLGINDSELCMYDTRLKKQQSFYKTNSKFPCIKTNLTGGVAIGNVNGEIRLYKAADSKRASTLLPGLGDAIRGIDVSLDGNWVLATCAKYLVLIPTAIEGEKTGFYKSIPEAKRNIIRLALNSIDIQKFNLSITIS